MTETPVSLRLATVQDIPAILSLIAENPDVLLPRTTAEMQELLETTWVVEQGRTVMGCCCLEIYSKKICEVRTLAVAKGQQGKGYGRLLVNAAVAEANRRGVPQILTITSALGFFERLGFGACLKEKYALFFRGTSGAKGETSLA
ncbi:MAG: GNAT family N-acetyltransferase [Proteobacteria bacterium]|nr:GNAT family N-acetyltransferase [Pseudomonadota bacterium]